MVHAMTQTDEKDVILSNQSLALLDELSVGAFTVDVNRKVKSMNLSAQALMGLREKDVIGKGLPRYLYRRPLYGHLSPQK